MMRIMISGLRKRTYNDIEKDNKTAFVEAGPYEKTEMLKVGDIVEFVPSYYATNDTYFIRGEVISCFGDETLKEFPICSDVNVLKEDGKTGTWCFEEFRKVKSF